MLKLKQTATKIGRTIAGNSYKWHPLDTKTRSVLPPKEIKKFNSLLITNFLSGWTALYSTVLMTALACVISTTDFEPPKAISGLTIWTLVTSGPLFLLTNAMIEAGKQKHLRIS